MALETIAAWCAIRLHISAPFPKLLLLGLVGVVPPMLHAATRVLSACAAAVTSLGPALAAFIPVVLIALATVAYLLWCSMWGCRGHLIGAKGARGGSSKEESVMVKVLPEEGSGGRWEGKGGVQPWEVGSSSKGSKAASHSVEGWEEAQPWGQGHSSKGSEAVEGWEESGDKAWPGQPATLPLGPVGDTQNAGSSMQPASAEHVQKGSETEGGTVGVHGEAQSSQGEEGMGEEVPPGVEGHSGDGSEVGQGWEEESTALPGEVPPAVQGEGVGEVPPWEVPPVGEWGHRGDGWESSQEAWPQQPAEQRVPLPGPWLSVEPMGNEHHTGSSIQSEPPAGKWRERTLHRNILTPASVHSSLHLAPSLPGSVQGEDVPALPRARPEFQDWQDLVGAGRGLCITKHPLAHARAHGRCAHTHLPLCFWQPYSGA